MQPPHDHATCHELRLCAPLLASPVGQGDDLNGNGYPLTIQERRSLVVLLPRVALPWPARPVVSFNRENEKSLKHAAINRSLKHLRGLSLD